MKRPLGAASAILILALLVPGAAAYHGVDGDARALVEQVVLDGATRLDADDGRITLTYGNGLAWRADAARVLVTVHEVPLGRSSDLLPTDGAREVVRVARADAAVALIGPGFSFNAELDADSPRSRLTLTADSADIRPLAPGRLAPFGEAARRAELTDAYSDRSIRPLATAAVDGAAIVRGVGDFTMFVYDATVSVRVPGDTTSLRVGVIPEKDVLRYAIVSIRDAAVHVGAPGGIDRFAAPRIDWEVNGTATWVEAHGRAAAGGDVQGVNGAGVRLDGVITGTATPEDNRLRVTGSGDVTAMTIGTSPTLRFLQASAPLVGLASLFGTLTWIAYTYPTVRYATAAALYARFKGRAALAHQARETIMAHLRTAPAASVDEVAEALGLAWSTTAYHLRVLERERHIVGTREGRHIRFTLSADHARKGALVILRNPMAMRVADAVNRTPNRSQREIAAAVGVAPSTAHVMLKRLAEAGVVRENRDGRVMRYAPATSA